MTAEPQHVSIGHWLGLAAFLLVFVVLALELAHLRRPGDSNRRALGAVAAWIALALVVGGAIGWHFGRASFVDYVTVYVVEKSLAVDNMFVFALMFSVFRIPRELQHGVLFWGIVGALVMRAGFILVGVALLADFHWLIYVFGAVLLVGASRIARPSLSTGRPGAVSRVIGGVLRTTPELHGQAFVIRDARTRRWLATPLLACLLALELCDFAFAIDSLPAAFGVTTDPYIVFTANAMALLGLHSLYLATAGALARFRFLRAALAAILGFIALKMLAHDLVHVPSAVSLAVIIAALGVATWWSRRAKIPGVTD